MDMTATEHHSPWISPLDVRDRYGTLQYMDITADGRDRHRTLQQMDFTADERGRLKTSLLQIIKILASRRL